MTIATAGEHFAPMWRSLAISTVPRLRSAPDQRAGGVGPDVLVFLMTLIAIAIIEPTSARLREHQCGAFLGELTELLNVLLGDAQLHRLVASGILHGFGDPADAFGRRARDGENRCA